MPSLQKITRFLFPALLVALFFVRADAAETAEELPTLQRQYSAILKHAKKFYSSKKIAKAWAKNQLNRSGQLPRGLTFSEQYERAYEFAYSLQGFNMTEEEAQKWAIDFVGDRGHLLPNRSLFQQYRAAYYFVKKLKEDAGEALDEVDTREWAKTFLEYNGYFSPELDEEARYDEAYDLAYSVIGLDLSEEDAEFWATSFVIARTSIEIN